jgi:hypothetical protein
MKRMIFSLVLTLTLFSSQSVVAWNGTGHKLVARIAWDDMTPTTRKNVIALLMKIPNNACLRERFSKDASRPLEEREREFFTVAATWPDIVRPNDKPNQPDTRPCIKYHRRDWHFVDFFWSGVSGDTTNPPTDLSIPVAEVNALERLQELEELVVSNKPASQRAIFLGWILHLVGDIHQPLHTSGRVTSKPNEKHGDGGGNAFSLGAITLHSYWDGIVDRQKGSVNINSVAGEFRSDHPRSSFDQLSPGDFESWVRESLGNAKNKAYPKSLKRGTLPSTDYQNSTFEVADESIAKAGYRLADLLNQLFGS